MKSLYDLTGGYGDNQSPVSDNNDTFPSKLKYFRDGGNIKGAPFFSKGGDDPSKDHMVDLLTKRINSKGQQGSKDTGGTYPNNTYFRGNDSDGDLEATTDSIGNATLFHGVNNPAVYQGKQLGGVDLHEALLTEAYTYNYGENFKPVPTPAKVPGSNPTSPSEALLSGQIDMDGLDYGNGRYSNPDNGQTYPSNS